MWSRKVITLMLKRESPAYAQRSVKALLVSWSMSSNCWVRSLAKDWRQVDATAARVFAEAKSVRATTGLSLVVTPLNTVYRYRCPVILPFSFMNGFQRRERSMSCFHTGVNVPAVTSVASMFNPRKKEKVGHVMQISHYFQTAFIMNGTDYRLIV